MEPLVVALWGLSAGLGCGAIARRVDRLVSSRARRRALDFYVLAWYSFSATGFVAAGSGFAVWAGAEDVALLATFQLALILSIVLAVAALVAAAAHSIAPRRAVAEERDPIPKGEVARVRSP